MSLIRFVAMTAAMVALIARPAPGQVPTHTLSGPEATFGDPFSSIAGLRELSDGRVLISDRLESAVRLIDFSSGSVAEVGRAGKGPGEFQSAGELLALPADSTLLVDFGNMRMTVITPEGSLLMESVSLMRPEGFFLRPSATDAAGNVYFDMEGVMMVRGDGGGPPQPSDSAAIARWDRSDGAVDTVGMLTNYRVIDGGMTKLGGGGASVSFAGRPYSRSDAWDVAPDGSLVIARAEPYRVEWRAGDRTGVTGPAVAYEPVPITRADKEAWADRLSGATVSIVRSSSGGGQGGGALKLPRPDIDEMEWPDVKPAFPSDAVSVTPEGDVWVQRHVGQGASETYDVFDHSGRRLEQVVLPKGRTLVGFGHGVAYLVRTDADDLQWLERYRR